MRTTARPRTLYASLASMLWLTARASAQFSGLAPTDDGSQLYFVSSLRLASELSQNLPGTPATAIYRIRAGAIDRMTVPLPRDAGVPNSYQGNPQVSGDGSVFSYTEYHQNCYGGSGCLGHPNTADSVLAVAGKPYGSPLTGAAQISSNGRFVVNAGQIGVFTALTDVRELRDLQSGTTVQAPVWPANWRQALTSDGRVLGLDARTGVLALWSSLGTRSLSTSESANAAIINDDATSVVYDTGAGHLRALNLSSGRDMLLASSSSTRGFNASISNDGNLVAYVASVGAAQTAQVFTIHLDGTGNAQLTNFPEGITEALTAGLGKIVFAVTGNRVVAIDAQSGAVQELIGPMPQCSAGFVSLIPGSILPIRGVAMTDSTEVADAPLPSGLGGVRVLADGVALPLLSVSPTEIWFQVPFEWTPRAAITVGLDHSSVFEGCPLAKVPVVERAPYFFVSGDLIAAHQDFKSLVTSGSPAQPGEVIHTYAVGLGAVTPMMVTGMRTPSDGLFRLTDPFECHVGFNQDAQPLEVVFAGLAPGMIGIYQVDIRVPQTVTDTFLFVNCGTPGNALERGGGGLPVALPH